MTQTHRSSFVPPDLDPANLEQVTPLLEQLIDREIDSPEALRQWLLDLSALDEELDEEGSRRSIDHACHTDDEAIEKRYLDWVQRVEPALKPIYFRLQKKLVGSPHVDGLDEAGLQLLARRWSADIELFRDENVPLQTKVKEKATEYGKLCGAMTVDFRGKTYTLQQLARFLQDPDRQTRQDAWELSSARRLEDREKIDAIFDELLTLRQQIAENAGLPDYRAYSWKRFKRFDYSPEDCLAFGDAIAEVCVPLVEQLDAKRRDALGVDTLRPWDLAVDVRGRGMLSPFDESDIDGFVGRTASVFDRIDPQLGEQFRTLKMGRNLDLESRRGKRPGGFQASLEKSRQPFIFMNAAGLQRDVETLLHEGGHAFNFMAARDAPIPELRHPPLEFAEVASMAMELLGAPHLDVFYDEQDARRARREHLEGIIRFFPWMATIDGYQHWLYTNPGHTLDQRTEQWLKLRQRFGSDIVDHSGYEAALAALWHRQLHLFSYPFYYIEYGIAQVGALQVWTRYHDDRRGAIADYRAALALGGRRRLPELFDAAGIRFDFSRSTFEPLIRSVRDELERMAE